MRLIAIFTIFLVFPFQAYAATPRAESGDSLPHTLNLMDQNNVQQSFESLVGDKVRHDKGKEGAPGHEGKDHYHRPNPDKTSKHDEYLDKDGNPTGRHSDASHVYAEE